jgi:sugar/nucleoside kinase (ribokinase family)
MRDFDLLVIGEINPDLILYGADISPAFGQAEKLVDEARLTIGSSSVIMACGAARLGLDVAFIGLVGDDELGRFMLRAMQEKGIDTAACIVDTAVPTGLGVILSQPNDRAILTFPGTIPLLKQEQIDLSVLSRARHVHVGGYFLLEQLRPALPGIFAEAKKRGLTSSLDTNWDPAENWDVAAMLPHCDVFLPNQEEVLRITGQDDLQSGIARLADKVSTLVVKLGEAGGVVVQSGETAVSAPALTVDVVDTTGAGDSFDAGFLYGFLHNWPVAQSVRLAAACGSLSTRGLGGTTAQPTLAEALAALRLLDDRSR